MTRSAPRCWPHFAMSSGDTPSRRNRHMAQAPAATLTQNVLREGLILSRTPDPAVMVIFGASGDLTARKLMPALYNLALNRYLPSGFSVIGVADTALTEDEFRAHMEQAVQKYSRRDRKSTRLNSSHVRISYAVFCLKKKKKTKISGAAVRHRMR